MSNSFRPAIEIFTKNSKIPFPIFKQKGFLSVVYTDDWQLQWGDYEGCFSNVLNAIEILGFTIHPDKSKFIPTQYIT